MHIKKTAEIGGRTYSFEVGKMAKQAHGSVVSQFGETVLLSTVCASDEPVANQSFFPLSVDYREKAYAGGKFPGGFFKREARPSEKEILSARVIDRPLRPLFPANFFNEVQVMNTVLASDRENDGATLGVTGSSLALCMSDIPFNGPVAAVTVVKLKGELLLNPTYEQVEDSELELVMAGSAEDIMMVEGEGAEISEEEMLAAIDFGHKGVKQLIALQNEVLAELEITKREVPEPEINTELVEKITARASEAVQKACRVIEKSERNQTIKQLKKTIWEEFEGEYPEEEKVVKSVIYDLQKAFTRANILDDNLRPDGRGNQDIRQIDCEIDLLPRVHGSALFTRGQTQALATITLGTRIDEQKVDTLEGEYYKNYMLHYNFPPYATGEVKRQFSVSRREVGHGHLAERSLRRMLPQDKLEFPYTIRIVSEILESNGSSSMATICAGSMAAMSAGVPVKKPVAGIAMGMIQEGDKSVILSDILGDEDHLGDMDFKVAGTRDGITAFQMDIKLEGIEFDILTKALAQARDGRLHILEKMSEAITETSDEISDYAPRIVSFQIPVDKIGTVIGPGGKIIRDIIERTESKIDIEDDGSVVISSEEGPNAMEARRIIEDLLREPEVGEVYDGRVVSVKDFGAFVEILPGQEGLLHISEIDHKRVAKVEDYLNPGDRVQVKLLSAQNGKLSLSRKAIMKRPEGQESDNDDRRPRRDDNRRR
jgi:polyribonucleotide nucleotidyltransferase